MNFSPAEIYQQLLTEYQTQFSKTKKRLQTISLLRFAAFLGIIVPFFFLKTWPPFVLAALSLTCFLFLIKKFNQKEQEKDFYQNLIQINEDELKALSGNFSHFNDGKEFIDLHHHFSYDLDLFGPQSFFQFLNRTSTQLGQKRLAEILSSIPDSVEAIRQKQQAIEELAQEINWRQHFAAKGKGQQDQQDLDKLHLWLNSSFDLKFQKTIPALLIIIPAITISTFLLFLSNLLPWGVVLLLILTQWGLTGFYGKQIKQFHQLFGNRLQILSKYMNMLLEIEGKPFRSEILKKLQQELHNGEIPASTICNKLKKRINEFDFRQNILVAAVLNSFLLWDIRCIYNLSLWHKRYHELPEKWFSIMAEFDALSSLANYNYNHQKWTLPTIQEKPFILKAEQLGHPLIDEKKRIDNDFFINGDGQLTIITGANMAGKSTFLRTVGINMILANNGCRVCASAFAFSPICLYTNMRATDNLMNDESYFYAELLRLQQMLELIRNGKQLFVIIDEMLRGTNSIDKLNGSQELVRQLIQLKAVGMVATHDLKLTELVQLYPQSIKNQCFEVQLNDDNLHFDYRLRDGVTQTMNATFLMKKMGIIP